jgi:hypothetical protein
VGYWALGTSDNFYCTTGFPGAVGFFCAGAYPGGVPYKSYWTWDAGVSFTYKAFTLDLRYYDTNLTKAECNVFDSDHTSTFNGGNLTNLNPGGLGSRFRRDAVELHMQLPSCPSRPISATSSKVWRLSEYAAGGGNAAGRFVHLVILRRVMLVLVRSRSGRGPAAGQRFLRQRCALGSLMPKTDRI